MTEQPHEPAIVLEGVTKRFGGRPVVDNLSLKIPQGTSFGLIGPNGAGKTTAIKMLMGLLRPDSGHAYILSMDPHSQPVALKRRVGYVPEECCIHRWMRVGEVIRFCRSFYDRWNDQRCDELIDLFELELDKKVRHLSKGMLAKLSLLLAVGHDAEVLILDEPMGGLDPLAREEFLDGVLRTLCEHHITILFSSHLFSDVQRLADTIGIICDGQLIVHDSVDALLAGTKRIRAIMRDGDPPQAPPEGTIWHRRHNREWLITVSNFSTRMVDRLEASDAVESVEVHDIGLEEIFKDIVRGRRKSA